ncbi:hypothetical protein FIBSPDRAFT_21647 [Athelia psychrophila]|uniref:50S ribosomal protein L35 n=1 Tax=Athelia psychrophila TaxID=1759441 RepID=A0A166UF06_9AGAM|nr:hypothetical protein FIBSPDRAFT_21647 [Fibularhizoctonia sp. CBS 109695]
MASTLLFSRLLPGPTARSFTSSAIQQLYKLKSHSGTKKRWKSIANGRFKRQKAGAAHLNVNKAPSRKNSLMQTAISHGFQTPLLKKLLPYGS